MGTPGHVSQLSSQDEPQHRPLMGIPMPDISKGVTSKAATMPLFGSLLPAFSSILSLGMGTKSAVAHGTPVSIY